MPLPTILYNYFNQGREQLEMSSALMNPYAKWMQSPNIPRNKCLPIALGNVEVHAESEPTVDEWFQNETFYSSPRRIEIGFRIEFN